ncbi:MAG: SLBB domain-containing protein [Magnetococcus sp. YQC-9]
MPDHRPARLWWRLIQLFLTGWLLLIPIANLTAEDDAVEEESSIDLPESAPEAEIIRQLAPQRGLRSPGGNLDQMRLKDSKKQTVSPSPGTGRSISLLESDFSLRAKSPLIQFGYNMFRSARNRTAPVAGSAPDSYVLGVGDQLIVTFRGKNERSATVKVDLEGKAMIPLLAEPMIASGRPFGEFREELRERIRTTQVGTEVFLSIGAFRFFSVYVMGEVSQPGMHRVTGLSTLLDALSTAGGVRKTGSLRTVQLHRNGEVRQLDLYSLLSREGSEEDPTLAVGDRIVVPPIGSVVAISGLVKRPGIYELPPGQKAVPLDDLLQLAGGTVTPHGNRFTLLKPDAKERESLVEIKNQKTEKISNGNIVLVEARHGPTLMGEVAIEGHVSRPHTRSLASAPTVRALLSDPELLLPDPYLPFGVIHRTDPKSRNRTFVPIDLGLIAARHEIDQPLTNHDVLIVLSHEDIRFLSSERVAEVLQRKAARNPCVALTRLEAVAASSDPLRFSNLFQFKETGALTGKGKADSPLMNTESAESLRLASAFQLQDAPASPDERIARPELSDLKAAPRMKAGVPTATLPETPTACPAIFNKFPDLLPLLLDSSVLLEGNEDRPTLFPILPGARMSDLVAIAQGVVGAAKFDKNLALDFQIDRKRGSREATRRVINLPASQLSSFDLQPGDVLRFKIGQVRLSGHVTREQQRPLQSIPTARHFLLDTDVLKPDPYLLFGVIRREDPTSRNRILAAVNLDAVIRGDAGSDLKFMDKDELVILADADVRFLSNPLVQSILLGKQPRQECNSLRHLADLMSSSDAYRFSTAINLSLAEFEQDRSTARRTAEKTTSMVVTEGPGVRNNECPAIYERHPEILPFVLENAAILTGEVRTPGVFPVTEGTRLSALVQSGGGVTNRVDLKQVELSRGAPNATTGKTRTLRSVLDFSTGKSFEDFQLSPGDVLRFAPIFSDREIGYVRLEGEFVRSGLYDLRRDDKLSDIIERAGGVTQHAFPYGAIFTRSSIQKSQKESFERVARELELNLASLVTSSKEKGDTAAILENTRGIITSLKTVQPLGRMVVEADLHKLKAQPELDIYLEAGDRLFMPKRPSEISVSGAVLNPGSFLYRAEHAPMDYIKWAGGFKDNASKGDTFIVLPDGRAQTLWSLSTWWDQQGSTLVPGSSIIVPMDPKPFELISSLKDMSQIISQWAITIASLAVLNR